MTRFARYLTAAAMAGGLAVPAAAQYPYPYPAPQPYPPTYPYGQQGVVGNILDTLLGRYAVNDRTAIRQCANAALVQAQRQYRPYGYGYNQPYNQPYGGQQYGYGMRVTAITDVDRRSSGLRVEGLLDSGMYGYGQQYGYNQAYGDLSFRCNVDYRGYVTSVRVRPTSNWRRRY
jgi:hypothetical protein